MIVITRGKLKFLNAGRLVKVDVKRQHRRYHDYAAGLTAHRTICRVLVLDSETLADGWRLTILRTAGDAPVYLAANPGAMRADYTENAARAARDQTGPIEAPDVAWLAGECKRSTERDDLQRREFVRQARLSRWRSIPRTGAS